jgi:CRP-like cAMP-binding protein
MYVTLQDQKHDRVCATKLSTQAAGLPSTRLSSGTHVFHDGDRVDYIYQVVSGVVRLTRLLEDGRRQIIAFGFPGDVVGFPSEGHHHTDCETLTSVELQPYRLSRHETCRTDPEFGSGLLRAALQEIAAMHDHFMMLGRKSASEKVASFLAVLANRVGESVGQYTQVTLPMSRADIADFLGLTTETVSRAFSQLRKSRVIALDGIHVVIILRPKALQALADGDRD